MSEAGRQVARVVPIAERLPGLLKGRIGMAPDLDETPDGLVEAFEGSSADDELLPR